MESLSLNNDYFVVCANELIKASQKMTLQEMKLIQIAIAQIKKDDEQLNTYVTIASDLAKFLNTDVRNIYRDYDNITDKLMGNIIKIQDEDRIKKFQWVSYCEYNRDTQEIKIRLHDELKPYLMGLNQLYTQITLEEIVSFNSYYALRLYQLLVCEYGISKRTHYELTDSDVRFFFGVEDFKYARNKDLFKKTIAAAIDEINLKEYCTIYNYTINHDLRKKGRPAVSVSFDVKGL